MRPALMVVVSFHHLTDAGLLPIHFPWRVMIEPIAFVQAQDYIDAVVVGLGDYFVGPRINLQLALLPFNI